MRTIQILVVAMIIGTSTGSAQTKFLDKDAPASPICHSEAPQGKDTRLAQQILQGYGTGGFPIQTKSPEAQMYFNNGMQLAHAFAHKSAIAAFRRAEQIDPSCAMCVWGEAWARGPSINLTIGDGAQMELARLTAKAAALAQNGTEREHALIGALQRRYKTGSGKGEGDKDYARAMDELSRAYPTDNEIAIMAADVWMIPASQENTRDHLDRAIQMLEAALQRSPNDTGAIHFF
jgi:tetratricopeptide (TPR) repeat protein